jgi:predicted acetyltransferase
MIAKENKKGNSLDLDITLEPVSVEQKSVLRQLLELASYDYSEFNGEDVNEHGLFDYPYLDHYWTEPGRWAFFIRIQQKLAGFVMVRCLQEADNKPTYSVAEFLVMRKYRGCGAGKAAAFQVFDRFHGWWHVSQEENNLPAQGFWRKIIAEYTHGNYEEILCAMGEGKVIVQNFVSRNG